MTDQEITTEIWKDKYRYGDERDLTSTMERVVEGIYKNDSADAYGTHALKLLKLGAIVPAGRVWAGAGTPKRVTLINCFVGPIIQDSMDTVPGCAGASIMDNLKVSALTQQMGGGIGNNFSTVRPKGALVRRTGSVSSGILPFMDMHHAMCGTVMSSGSRRGAMMGTLSIWHPDIRDFIKAKHTKGRLTNFNVSVLVTDDFMAAVKDDADWDLGFGVPRADGNHVAVHNSHGPWFVYERLKARELWDEIIKSTYVYAEPGVIFIDRVNQWNNLAYCEEIQCTNPCGEQPLPPDGDCDLGHVNLAVMVRNAFEKDPTFNWDLLSDATRTMVRFLDNVLDVTLYPTSDQENEAKAKRRVGLGYTGLGNALQQLKVRYGSKGALEFAARVGRVMRDSAYQASVDLAMIRGPFPKFDADRFCERPFIRTLPAEIQGQIRKHGIRNGVLLTLAPTGTTSILMGNVSSGIEPSFLFEYDRKVLNPDGKSFRTFPVYDYGYLEWKKKFPGSAMEVTTGARKLPDYMVTAKDLTVDDHLGMQAVAQKYIDSSISKTINCPAEMTFEDFRDVYSKAYEMGCKGCTTYRPDPTSGRGEVLSEKTEKLEKTEAPGKVPMQEVLDGRRYRIKWPGLDQALYIQINDYVDAKGQRRPFELFISTKSAKHDEWIKAVSLLITAIFRREGDVSFVVEELKQVCSAFGGNFFEGRYVPSIPAALAYRIEEHLRWLGLLKPQETFSKETRELVNEVAKGLGEICEKCNSPTIFHVEGCKKCTNCGFSDCG